MVKRFAIFSGDDGEPSGGWRDFADSTDSELEAHAIMVRNLRRGDWAQVVDLETGEIIHEEPRAYTPPVDDRAPKVLWVSTPDDRCAPLAAPNWHALLCDDCPAEGMNVPTRCRECPRRAIRI